MMNADDATARTMIRDASDMARPRLDTLSWGHGLTREDIRDQWRHFPQVLYLRLPSSKRFANADEVLRYAANFSLHAEGEFPDVNSTPEEVDAERQVFDLGGPPTYGPDPLLAGDRQNSGSATDTEGLDSDTDVNSEFDTPIT